MAKEGTPAHAMKGWLTSLLTFRHAADRRLQVVVGEKQKNKLTKCQVDLAVYVRASRHKDFPQFSSIYMFRSRDRGDSLFSAMTYTELL